MLLICPENPLSLESRNLFLELQMDLMLLLKKENLVDADVAVDDIQRFRSSAAFKPRLTAPVPALSLFASPEELEKTEASSNEKLQFD